jgi:hypothetical protein
VGSTLTGSQVTVVDNNKVVITTTAADYYLRDKQSELRLYVSGVPDVSTAFQPPFITLIINWVHPCDSASLTETGWAGLSKQLNDATTAGITDSASFDVFPY